LSLHQDIPACEKSVGAVIFRRVEGMVLYLLLHYEEGHWGSSKGHVEGSETLEQTARREIREETGLTALRFLEGFQREMAYSFPGKKGIVHKSVVLLLAETPDSAIRLSDEHTEYGWFACNAALERVTYPEEKTILAEAADYLRRLHIER
jgi:8-oxo-dGTP pyrophosphatase MutT (NUDIX family)